MEKILLWKVYNENIFGQSKSLNFFQIVMEGGAMDGIRGANMAGQTDAMYQVIFSTKGGFRGNKSLIL